MLVRDTSALLHAQSLAHTAASIAHEAQPYPQDSSVFKGLADLTNAMSAAALRCLTAAMEPEAQQAAPATEEPQAQAEEGETPSQDEQEPTQPVATE